MNNYKNNEGDTMNFLENKLMDDEDIEALWSAYDSEWNQPIEDCVPYSSSCEAEYFESINSSPCIAQETIGKPQILLADL